VSVSVPSRTEVNAVRDLRQSRGLEIVNGSKPYCPAGVGRALKRGHPRCAVQWFLSPHPSPLPCGEGEPFSPRRTIQTRWLSTARCALFPLPAAVAPKRRFGAPRRRKGQGEGKRRELPSRVSELSRNCRTGRLDRQSWRYSQMTMTGRPSQRGLV